MRWSLAILAALLVTAAVPAVAAADDEPPVISSASLTPSSLPQTGGTVTITANVTDDVGLSMVYAEINGTDGTFQTVDLTFQSGTLYKVTVSLPPNGTFEPIGYSVTVWALDTNGSSVDRAAGEATVAGMPQFDEPPIVGETSVLPTTLPAAGGVITFKAVATDHRSVSEVFATIALPGGGSTQVPMESTSADHYEGTFNVPANTKTTSVQYAVSVTALDDISQATTEPAGTVTVAGRPVPSAGKLKLAPDKVSFGDVKLGAVKQHKLEIKNEGKKNTAPIEFTARTSGEPFSIVGANHFTLAPGQKVVVVLAFTPLSIGDKRGTLTVERADGAQPGLAAALKGKGKKK